MIWRMTAAWLLLLFAEKGHGQKQEFQDKYPNGTVRSEGVYEAGFEDGLWKYYYEDGTLQEKTNYRRGKLNGPVWRYHQNGRQMVEGYFVNDAQDSIQRTWSADSVLLETGYWNKGKKIGYWHYFKSSGDSSYTECFKGDSLLLWTVFDDRGLRSVILGKGYVEEKFEGGQRKRITHYNNGFPDSLFCEYYSGGSERIRGNYTKGKKTGIWTEFFPGGKPKSHVNYQNGLLHGPFEEYYPNGQLSVKGEHREGMKSGYWNWYLENGKPDMEGSFENDLQEGDWVYWYANGNKQYWGKYSAGRMNGLWSYQYWGGQKWKEGNYVHGQKNGRWTTWYESGKTLNTGSYENDLEEGEWLNYYENGKLKDKGHYTTGRMDGRWEGFYPSGLRSYTGEWAVKKEIPRAAERWVSFYNKPDSLKQQRTGDVKTGTWSYWGENGAQERVETYNLNGDLHGVAMQYGPAGKLESEGKYKEGKPHGPWTYYYPHGSVLRTCEYKDGRLDGPSVIYNERGRVIEEASYKENRLHGEYVAYDERTGKVKLKQVYDNGKVAKVLEGKPAVDRK
jgi:uncharacterized protein